jgi:hypothetical protein
MSPLDLGVVLPSPRQGRAAPAHGRFWRRWTGFLNALLRGLSFPCV